MKNNRRVRLQLEALEDRAVPTIMFMPHFGPETVAPGSANLGTQHPAVNLVFSGPFWTTPTGQQDEATILNSTKAILGGPYLSGLTQYGSDGIATFSRSWNDPSTLPNNPSAAIQGFLQNSIFSRGTDPGNTDYRHAPIYVVVSDPNFSANSGGKNAPGTFFSLQYSTYLGFPTFVPEKINMVYVGTQTGADGHVILDWFTMTLSHEFAEVMSDPGNQGAHFNPPGAQPLNLGNQIADNEPELGSTHYGYRLNGALVQPYWSNRDQAFIVPDGNSQNFYLYPIWNDSTATFTGTFNLSVIGDQIGVNYADNIQIGGTANASVTMNNQSAIFESGTINAINVNTAGGNNSVKVYGLPAAVTLNLDSSGFNGFDQVLIGNNGSLAGIQGTVNVANHSGQSSVTINDTNDGARNITLTDHSVTYSGLTTINYTAGYLVNGYEHGVSTLVLNAGSGSQIDVLSVGPLTDTEIYLYWNLLNKVYGPAASQVHVHIYWLVAQ
jgi:hypothetical protein